jgi:hypothetical protein
MKTALAALAGVEGACSSAGAGETWETARDMFSIPLPFWKRRREHGQAVENASEEVARILAAADVTDSAVTGAKIDYTSFRPGDITPSGRNWNGTSGP